MRITQIRSPADFGWWCLDQVGHGAIVLAAVSWFATSVGDVAIAGAVILTIREGEQGRRTVKEWRQQRQGALSWNDRKPVGVARQEIPTLPDLARGLHLPDRFGDIAGGVAVSTAAFVGWQLFLGLVG